MKTVMIPTIALLVGLFLGGLGPRADVRRLAAELVEAKREAEAARACGGERQSLFPVAALGALAAAAGQRTQAPVPPPRFVKPTGGGAEVSVPDAGAERRRRGRLPAESLAAAKVSVEMVGAMQRAQFFDQARLSVDKQAVFDELVKKMNAEIAKATEDLVRMTQAQGSGRPTFRPVADAATRVLEVYRRADDELKAGLDDVGRAALDKTRFDIISQIDLGAFEKVAQAAQRQGEAGGNQGP